MYSLEVHITDRCNLNCKSCTHFCPLVPTSTPHKDLSRIIRDLIRLNAIKCTPNFFKILGGEPLLHPDLTDYLEQFRGVLPSSDIIIWTNGLLLPKMDQQFYEKCRFYNIKMVVTPYLPTRHNESIRSIVDHNSDFIRFDGYFSDEFWCSPLSRDRQSPYINYDKCRIKTGRCNILEDGKIYQCALPAFAHYLQDAIHKDDHQLNVLPNSGDYVDIYEIWNEKDLIEKLYQPTPYCSHCSAERGENHPWCQSSKDWREWITD